jgi:nitrate/TMAO reductase-like tetraheme cytochrome c subunit
MHSGPLARLWRFLWRPSATISLAVLLIAGAVGGLALWGGFNAFVEYASSETFCVSCHEMRDHAYADLQRTVHFVNRTGTRATCVDCHVPREFVPKIIAKAFAIKDLVFHLTGKIDTPEKYEAHRLEMALAVWGHLKGDDSRECRNCHQNVWTDTSAEFRRAAVTHKAALENGKLTCIDCHQGIAHRLPSEFARPPEADLFADPDGWFDAMRAAAAGE